MTPEERFVFDLEGYLVVKNVLSGEEIAELNEIVDRRLAEEKDRDPGLKVPRLVSQWGRPFQNLFDHPNITPYLVSLIGAKFRADQDYGIFMRKGAEKGRLHGHEWQTTHTYHFRDGVMLNGLIVVVYFLAPSPKGAGGFACIPGSHKSNFAPADLPDDVRYFKRIPHYVVNPEADAGDALIFTEACIHGTLPWAVDEDRRTLLYKFSPGHSASSSPYYNQDDYDGLTDQQKRVLDPPFVGRAKEPRQDSLDAT